MKPRWTIEKAYPGRYHNSPWVWRKVGQIKADSELSALRMASRIVGGWNPVRVAPATVSPIFHQGHPKRSLIGFFLRRAA